MHPIVFGILAALLVLSALGVVTARSPIRSALSLVVTLFLLAVTFLFLDAHLVAALQIIVYAGAIVVLFLFVIMLLNLQEDPPAVMRTAVRGISFAGGSLFLFAGIALFLGAADHGAGMTAPAAPSFGTTEVIARQLFTKHLLAFEATGVLLLVAVVGAVVMAKRKLV